MKWFWRKEKAPEPVRLELCEISMDAKEREDVYFLLHALDGIELHRRVEDPLDHIKRVHEVMNHFAGKKVFLPWDVEELKRVICEYEERAS